MTVIPALVAAAVLVGVMAVGLAVLVRGRDRKQPTRLYSYVSDAPPDRES